jgi:hypothetical protein
MPTGAPLLLEGPDRRGRMRVKSLGPRRDGWSGDQLLQLARERAKSAGASHLALQDASFLSCGGRAAGADVSLAILHLLRDGRTWYEARGFAPVRGRGVVRSARSAAAALRAPGTYERVLCGLRGQLDGVGGLDARAAYLRAAVRALEGSPSQSFAASVSGMGCRDAAAVLRAVVGERERMFPAARSVGGTATPMRTEFMRLRRLWSDPRLVEWEAPLPV